MRQVERSLAVLFFLFVFGYVLLRAWTLGTYPDEAGTIIYYVLSGNFIPPFSKWDANNHLLNSALASLFSAIGADLFWLRLPNVLSFGVYSVYLYQVTQTFKYWPIRMLSLLALLVATFPLDFFSICRGYGMSLAFMVAAIYHASLYLNRKGLWHQIIMWIWVLASVTANLTLIHIYPVLLLTTVWLIVTEISVRKKKQFWIWTLLGLTPFTLLVYYGFKLRDMGLLYAGSGGGVVEVTIRSLIRFEHGSESHTTAWTIFFLSILSAGFLIKKGNGWTPVRLSASILLSTVLVSVLGNGLLSVNFLEDRLAVFLMPLFFVCIAGSINELARKCQRLKWLGLLFLFVPYNTARNLSLTKTRMNGKWHFSKQSFEKLRGFQKDNENPLIIAGEEFEKWSFSYYNLTTGNLLQPISHLNPTDTLSDFVIGRFEDLNVNRNLYKPILNHQETGLNLYARSTPVVWDDPTPLEIGKSEVSGNAKTFELATVLVDSLESMNGCFNLSVSIYDWSVESDLSLVFESVDSVGNREAFDTVDLNVLRTEWKGDLIYLRRAYHLPLFSVSCRISILNPEQRNLEAAVHQLTYQTLRDIQD